MSPPSVDALRRLRRELHRYPDLSGHEAATAARIVRLFQPLQPDECIPGSVATDFVHCGVHSEAALLGWAPAKTRENRTTPSTISLMN